MNYEIESGYIKMQGFEIGNKILISEADEVTYLNFDTGENEKSKQVEVVLEIETLKSWIEECGFLDDIRLMEE